MISKKLEIPAYRRPSSPGEIIRDMFLGEGGLGVTQGELADKLGISRQNFNAIINGRRAVSISMAMRLEQVLGVDAQTWINLQLALDIYDARHSSEAKRIAKLKRVRAA